jgi:hypothetical protein
MRFSPRWQTRPTTRKVENEESIWRKNTPPLDASAGPASGVGFVWPIASGGLAATFRKNGYFFFAGFFAGAFLAGAFLVLHPHVLHILFVSFP